jgi:hypothetical protein
VSLELLNTLASLATTLIVAATAIAAIVQLRHLRAGNQIAGQLALRQVLLDDNFMSAMRRIRMEVPALVTDPDFHTFVYKFHVEPQTKRDDRYEDVYTAALMVGRNLENIGNMVRNGLTDERVFLEQYDSLVVAAWEGTEPLLRMRREAEGTDTAWEDFEYLTVLARKRLAESRSVFPKGAQRILPSRGGGAPS